MKKQAYQCMANVGNVQCKNMTTTPDYRCGKHKSIAQSQTASRSVIPAVGGSQQSLSTEPRKPIDLEEALVLKSLDLVSSLRKKKTKDIFKDRYTKRPKDPKDYSGATSVYSGPDKVYECILTGIMTGNSWMLGTGIVASGFVGSALFAAARYKLGLIDVGANPDIRKYDVMVLELKFQWAKKKPKDNPKDTSKDKPLWRIIELTPDTKKAIKEEQKRVEDEAKQRLVRIRSEKVKPILERHWGNLEAKAKNARGSFINDIESSVPKGHTRAALLYENFREQFYAIAADADPAAAALKRADEIESYPQEDATQYLLYPPFIVPAISDEERVAAQDIVNELRAMAESFRFSSSSGRLLG